MYGGADLLGLLLMFKKLPMNTKIHHIFVMILIHINSGIDYNQETFWKGIIINAFFSCFSYSVNAFLGIHKFVQHKYVNRLCLLATVVYISCCSFNWSYQIYTFCIWLPKIPDLSYGNMIGFAIYIFLTCGVIMDDVTLIRYEIKYMKAFSLTPTSNDNKEFDDKESDHSYDHDN